LQISSTQAPFLTNDLNPYQLQAVQTVDGPLLVLAGAGTGKTKVLTSRVVHLIHKGVFPGNMLVVTFTNKAASEMKERIQSMLNHSAEGLWLGTFHSVAMRILRRCPEKVGLKPNFTIIDQDDQIRIAKQILAEHHIDDKESLPKVLIAIINRWKDSGLLPHQVTAAQRSDFAGGKSVQLYIAYQERLRALNAADFGDLLLYNIQLFTQDNTILAEYQQRFHYILVDEYQDTNIVQYLWLRLLAQGHHNICCVGDDDQSIYGWRGAQVGNILRFEKDFPNASVIRLERNYRSTSHILAAASTLISHNRTRMGKTLWTEGNEGQPIKLWCFWDDLEEATAIADEVEHIVSTRALPLDEIAILVRASFQTRSFEEHFISRAIPYKVVGGLRFYERLEVKDITAYLRLVQQPYDVLAFERIANVPKRGIGTATLQHIIHTARGFSMSVPETIERLLSEPIFRGKAKDAMVQFLQHITKWQALKATATLAELTEIIIRDSGYLAMWQAEKTPEGEGRVENIKELLSALDDFTSLDEFLDHVSLVMDKDKASTTKMVNIMTLHAAKGLEFDTVFLPGWEHGIFPHQKALDEHGSEGLEEERRLAYVGITRAKHYAYITFASRRRIYGRYQHNIPSRFIAELPKENIDSNYQENLQASHYGSIPVSSTPSQKAAPSPTPKTDTGKKIALGARIFHIKFGYGTILAMEGGKLDIAFEKAGRKTVMDSYVEVV
jgi:DNA helicase II / ATP-dependent DNA helicase PcrA